ncbi:hypothetical protein CU098_008409 [Rhizopus stolonifer]|uniref:PiggyBac transposable element-derived protein domain-containing protein n=1 Tax=Rhizopus stolonifer TaxID=4846 RepID=A0A367IXP9_RHIST|nr:hypothetical protein CU098_008409 [Rhizopus stolonifer]
MPRNDIMQCLSSGRRSSVAMWKKDYKSRVILVCAHRNKKRRDGQVLELRRPQVFDDYEYHKSSVDANNNRKDNMVSFHDVMKTYRWEVRFLSFVLGIA